MLCCKPDDWLLWLRWFICIGTPTRSPGRTSSWLSRSRSSSSTCRWWAPLTLLYIAQTTCKSHINSSHGQLLWHLQNYTLCSNTPYITLHVIHQPFISCRVGWYYKHNIFWSIDVPIPVSYMWCAYSGLCRYLCRVLSRWSWVREKLAGRASGAVLD